MADTERVRVVIEGDSGDLQAACRQAVAGIRGVGTASAGASRHGAALEAMGRKQADTLRSWGRAAYYAAGGVTALGVGLAGRALVDGLKFNAAFQDAETSFKTFLGTAERAQTFVEKLRADVANVSPFRLTEFMDASKQLMGFGMGADEVVKTLKAVNAAVIASGGNVEILDRVVLSLGQIKATGKLGGDELRQLAEAGIPVQKILQKELHLTGEQVADIGKQGISAQRGLDAIRKGLTDKYGSAAKDASENFSLQVARLRKDAEQIERLATKPLFDYLNKRVFPEALRASQGVTEIFKRTDIDLGEKLRLSRDEVSRILGPVVDEMRDAIGEAHIDEWLEDRFNDAIPKLANAAGQLGVKAAGAFAHAFVNSDLLGRAVLGGWLLSKSGVFAYWKTYGRQAGQAAGAEAATGMAGGMRGKMPGLMRGLSIALPIALILGPDAIKKVQRDLSGGSEKFKLPKHIGSSLVEMTGGLLPAAGIDALAGLSQGEKKLRDFGDTAEETARKFQKAGNTRGLAQMGDQARALAREFPGSSRELRRFADAVEKAAGDSVAGQFRKMGAAGTHSLRGIQRTVADTDFEIRNRLGPGTKAGKDALARNFMLAAAAVREHMREAGHETAKGVAQMRKYMRAALAEQGITGKEASRYIAGQDTITGKRDPGPGDVIGGQRGLTTLGARNQAGRDTIPILAAAGEDVAVFNRHQRAALDYSLAQTYGTDLRGLFGAVKQDHAMPLASNPLLRGYARGGIVQLGHRLQGMGFQVGENPAFGGVAPVHAHYGAADHYHGGALDVNHDQGGEDAALTRLAGQLKGQGWHVLWHVPDHFDHLHVDIGGGGGGTKGLGESVKVKRAKFPGGFGAMSALGQAGLDDLRRAMQTRVDSVAGDQVASGGVGDMGAGGEYDKAELKALWRRAGGAGSMANIMAAIALAESGGNPTARNPSGASGLWQILGVPFPGDPFDPLTNAKMAVSKLGSQGLTAWEVYTKGSYQQYMQQGGLVDAIRAQGGFAPQPVATAGATKKKPPKKVKHKPSKKLGLKKLKAVLPLDEIKQLANLDQVFEQRDATYGRVEREQGLTDETLTVTPPGSTTEVRNEPDIARRASELGVLIGLRSQIRGLLSQQWAILAAASKTIGQGIAERIAKIRAIKDKVAGNVKRLHALKKALDGKPSDARKKAIKAEMKTLRDQNTRLAGEADKLGDGGELGKTRTALNTWREQKEGLDTRVKDLPGKLEDERLNIAELVKEKATVEGTSIPPTVAAGGSDSALNDLVKQQLAESQEALRISRTEMGVFARFLPLFGGRLVGAFAHGGLVPETGLALVHRDEMITPDPQGPYGRQIPPAGPVVGAAPQITLVFDSNSGELVRLVDARIDGKATKVVTEQAGRRSRMLMDAPGR